jgi:hypothetical protein
MNLTPQQIVAELDKHVVGQAKAKRAVAIALRNRWRRQQVPEPLRQLAAITDFRFLLAAGMTLQRNQGHNKTDHQYRSALLCRLTALVLTRIKHFQKQDRNFSVADIKKISVFH